MRSQTQNTSLVKATVASGCQLHKNPQYPLRIRFNMTKWIYNRMVRLVTMTKENMVDTAQNWNSDLVIPI